MSRRAYSYSTGEDIQTALLEEIGDDVDTSIAALQEDSLRRSINRLQRRVAQLPFAGIHIGPLYIPPTERHWDFLEEEKEYSILDDDSLAAALAAGETSSIALATGTGWDTSSGAFVTYDDDGTWDYITFATRSGVTLSTLTDVGLGNASGDAAVKLYALPSNFDEVIKIKVAGLDYTEVDFNPSARQFAIINQFLWFMKNHGDSTAQLLYQKKVTDLTEIASSLSTPDRMDDFYIEALKARAFRLNGNPEADVNDAYQNARNALLAFLNFSTHSSNRRIRTVRGPIRSPTS